MLSKLKNFFYFPGAHYFRFLAKLKLLRWKPYIIVVTGSSGKTTLLHLIESQMGNKAKYSHLANSSYGVPFDILGLKRKTLMVYEWLFLFILAPFMLFKKNPSEKFYVVETDCDRPGEGKFLATLLKPKITLWTGVSRTHTANFNSEATKGKFRKVEKAIAFEYGFFIEKTSELAVVNGDLNFIAEELKRAKGKVVKISIKNLKEYKVGYSGTVYRTEDKTFEFKFLLPKEFFYSLQMMFVVLDKLNIKADLSFKNFSIPPGRSKIFNGIKNTTIIDSTYNATPEAVSAVLNMFSTYPSKDKWLVLGDMIELGNEEREEHENLSEKIAKIKARKIILVGPRLSKYTYTKLRTKNEKLRTNDKKVVSFIMPKEALSYIEKNLRGGETILFKGARFLEGVIENLLEDKRNIDKLPRREKVWEKRRKKFGL
ncbi:MAG: hypothetical protein A2958_02700 [Candidatus Levybacteria bacterium RIFCSPLOWO2_01_FULL_38_13]|nr:MAG: hypothetical protein A2629_03120 [Candidatus Levybacteria bacterium RIFCSPHIGHO2_01_FULL_41_15]OGH35246.1 MAG: hypothetical protein A2958_02700 [Candidatus Levybacteria bacterium RIFCSPLOWO2_01_FULL_38_13]